MSQPLPGIIVNNNGCQVEPPYPLPAVQVENDCCTTDGLGNASGVTNLDDFLYIGYKNVGTTAMWDLSDAEFPAEYWIVIDFNWEWVGNPATSAELLTLLNLMELGIFSLDGDELSVTGNHNYANLQPVSTAAAPIVGARMSIDITTPDAITDCYCISTNETSKNNAKAGNMIWKAKVSEFKAKSIEWITGSNSNWVLYVASGGDGINMVPQEVTDRGENIATLQGGIGDEVYGYDWFDDALAYIVGISPEPKITVAMNVIRPVLNGSYVQTFAEVDAIIAKCAAAGVVIDCIQVGYENGLRGVKYANDTQIFLTAADLVTAMQTIVDYIDSVDPTIPIGVDADNWDDANPFLGKDFDNISTLNKLINLMTNVDFVRQYLEVYESSYSASRTRIQQTPAMVDYFVSVFTNGQKMRLAQPVVKAGSPIRLKVGEGLLYAEWLILTVQENLDPAHTNIIRDFVHYDGARLWTPRTLLGEQETYPAGDMMILGRDTMQNNGRVDVTFTDVTGSESLVKLGVAKGAVVEVFILNPTAFPILLPLIEVGGVGKNVTVEALHGDPLESAVTSYSSAAGPTATLQPNSWTKITTV